MKKMKYVFRLNLVFIVLVTLTSIQRANAENPCGEEKRCRQVSLQEAMALPWKEGVRDFVYVAKTPLEFEATYNCKNCMTYHSLFGEKCTYDRYSDKSLNPEASVPYNRYSYYSRRDESDIIGLMLHNEGKVDT
ncbi:MAG: hypothetical protein KDD40_03175, partial [Bdellovibrionales bacterium]|nr:hypothetical protein [Bdellovibrionales bacterium]